MKKYYKWLFVFIYTLIIYLTLPFGPDIIKWLTLFIEKITFNSVNGYNTIGWLAAAFILFTLIFILIKILKSENNIKKLIYFFIILMVYAYFLIEMKVPTEKIHFIEYGVLAFLIFNAFREHFTDNTLFFSSGLLVYTIGCIDEVIQHYLPQRTGEFVDVIWNFIASALILLLIKKCFDWKAEKKYSKKSLSVLYFLSIIAFAITLLFFNFIPEYGSVYNDSTIGKFYSRLSLNQIKLIDENNFLKNSKILNSTDDKEYKIFLEKYNAKKNPFIHELRVHIFRRDRYFAYYQHYKFLNHLADKTISSPEEYLENLKFKKYLYSYILNYLKKDNINNEVLKEYINKQLEKKQAINKGLREKTSDKKLLNYLFIAYKENLIIEKYFKKTISNTKFLWADEKAFIQKIVPQNILNNFYESSVSNRIVTYISRKNINIFFIFALILFHLFFVQFYKKIKANNLLLIFLLFFLVSCNNKFYKAYYISNDNLLKIDGTMTESQWKRAQEINTFYNIKTDKKIENKTKAKILYSKKYLYIGFLCKDDFIYAIEKKRDGQVYNDDVVEIFIQPDKDKNLYYEFEVNALNTVFDALIEWKEKNIDFGKAIKWDCNGLSAGAAQLKNGYSVEIKIPLNQINIKDKTKVKFNIFRIDRDKDKNYIYYAFNDTQSWFHEIDKFIKLIFTKNGKNY